MEYIVPNGSIVRVVLEDCHYLSKGQIGEIVDYDDELGCYEIKPEIKTKFGTQWLRREQFYHKDPTQ